MTMSNVISFSKKKQQKQELSLPPVCIYEAMDAKFRGSTLSTKAQTEVRKWVKERLGALGYQCCLTSKKVDVAWLKQYKPLLLINLRIGFSFEVSKRTKLTDGWVFYPLPAKPVMEYATSLTEIIQLIEDHKNGK